MTLDEFCPTCGMILSMDARFRRTRITITPLGRAALAEMRKEKVAR